MSFNGLKHTFDEVLVVKYCQIFKNYQDKKEKEGESWNSVNIYVN